MEIKYRTPSGEGEIRQLDRINGYSFLLHNSLFISLFVLGNYSVYGLEIHLSRCVSPYLLNVYLPTAIFVVMSWVSFLIPTDVVPARIVLLVTLCLVIINTFNNVT